MFDESKYINLNGLRVLVENDMRRQKEYEILDRAGAETYYAVRVEDLWPKAVYVIKKANIVRVAGD